jgi:hypothetical protein
MRSEYRSKNQNIEQVFIIHVHTYKRREDSTIVKIVELLT